MIILLPCILQGSFLLYFVAIYVIINLYIDMIYRLYVVSRKECRINE